MKIIDGIDIDKKFTSEEILDLHAKGKLRSITLEGYATRADADGTITFIPWYESSYFRMRAGTPVVAQADFSSMTEEVEREHPIIRRTPQERVVAMAMRLVASAQASGSIGLTTEQVNQVVGESWKEGTPMTGEAIQAVATALMTKAEKLNREADGRRVTRQHMTA